MDTVNLLGLCFDNLNVPEVVTKLLDREPDLPFVYVVTPNADHVTRLHRSPGLFQIYEKAWLCLLDSHVISNAARLCHVPAPQVSTGADITTLLLASTTTQTVAIIGFSPAYLLALRARYPATIFLLHTPPMHLLKNPTAFAAARDFAINTRADFTFIALGSPLQELLAEAIAAHPSATGIGMCIGAALEFCAGVTPRAPAWMQRAGLEWLHRLVRNPRRLSRRYLIDNPPVLFSLAIEGFRLAWAHTDVTPTAIPPAPTLP